MVKLSSILAANGVNQRINKCADLILRPVTAHPVFFSLLLLLGASTPVAHMLILHNHLRVLTLLILLFSFVWSYLFAAVVLFLPGRAFKAVFQWVILIFYALRAAIETGSLVMVESPINYDSILLMVETNTNEAKGFMSQYFTFKVVFWLLLEFALVVGASKVFGLFVRKISLHGLKKSIVSTICLALLVFGGVKVIQTAKFVNFDSCDELWGWSDRYNVRTNWSNRLIVTYSDPILNALFFIKTHQLMMGDVGKWLAHQNEVYASGTACSGDKDFDVVVVIGESFIRRHSPLYGYGLNTNPNLVNESAAGRLVTFEDMMTTCNFTTFALRNCLNLNSISRGERWSTGIYFPMVMKQGGYPVYFYDNQTVSPHSDVGIGAMLYSGLNTADVYSDVSDKLFILDGDFIDYVHERQQPGSRCMTVYHLLGQHFPFENHYSGAGHFSCDDIAVAHPSLDSSGRENVMKYDNATFYNDSVVSEIMQRWSGRPTLLFYFSDHGEDIEDLAEVKARNVQQPDDWDWIDRQYHVPFFVWMSDSFLEAYPAEAQRVRAVSGRPGSLDDIGHAIIGITGIVSPYYRPERDIFSDEYRPVPRVAEAGYLLEKPQ